MKAAVTGATGFIGARIVACLLETGANVVSLVRSARLSVDATHALEGDLGDPVALDRLVADVDVLIHAASYVGPDEAEQVAVNVNGTARLLAAAQVADVPRVIYVSTAGVYGGTLSRGGREDQLVASPRSPLSRSRRAAEIQVLEHGGTVIRPNLVVGAGDRWFLLPLLRAMAGLDAWIEDGAARASVIEADLLGRAIAGLATQPHDPGVYHAARPEPVTIRQLVMPVYGRLGRPAPRRSITASAAHTMLAARGVTKAQLAIVSMDNWFDSHKLWRAVPHVNRRATVLHDGDVRWYADGVSSATRRGHG